MLQRASHATNEQTFDANCIQLFFVFFVFHSQEHVGFNIEVKMATPDDLARTPDEEIERMVRPILEVVAACSAGSERPIVFSSFDPDVCAALRQRQEAHPVMFLSTGGSCAHADPRRHGFVGPIVCGFVVLYVAVRIPVRCSFPWQFSAGNAHRCNFRVCTSGIVLSSE